MERPTSHLPIYLTPFIGRERELANLGQPSTRETKDCAAHLRAELEAQLTRPQVQAAQARAQAQTFEAVVNEVWEWVEFI